MTLLAAPPLHNSVNVQVVGAVSPLLVEIKIVAVRLLSLRLGACRHGLIIARNLPEDGMVFTVFAECVTFLTEVIERDEGDRNVSKITPKRRPSQLRHDLFLTPGGSDQGKMARATRNRACQIFKPENPGIDRGAFLHLESAHNFASLSLQPDDID